MCERKSITDAESRMISVRDPETSHEAAKSVKEAQCWQLLRSWLWYPKAGLTDEEAAIDANIIDIPFACWWHRCSDLRALGYIEWLRGDDGKIVKRLADSGRRRGVSVITPLGAKQAQRLGLW